MSDIEDKTATLLAALWVRNLPIVYERLATLERTAAAAGSGALNAELLREATSCAHKLAGSLGMYGYDEGTRIAREVEQLLGEADFDKARLSGLIAELRKTIFPSPNLVSAQ